MENVKTELPKGVKWPDDTRFKFFAVDSNGAAFFLSVAPTAGLCAWFIDFGHIQFAGLFPRLARNWQNSLITRPEDGHK